MWNDWNRRGLFSPQLLLSNHLFTLDEWWRVIMLDWFLWTTYDATFFHVLFLYKNLLMAGMVWHPQANIFSAIRWWCLQKITTYRDGGIIALFSINGSISAQKAIQIPLGILYTDWPKSTAISQMTRLKQNTRILCFWFWDIPCWRK